MHTPFEKLSDSTRVWIYQSSRAFTETETKKINEILSVFLENWNNHGDDLKSSYTIKYNQFIILAVDENFKEASGCSIDSSVQVIKKIEKLTDIDLFDKMKTAFKINENINVVSLSEFQKYAKEGKVNNSTIVFNNMVSSILEYKNNWEVPAKKSWHTRYFNN